MQDIRFDTENLSQVARDDDVDQTTCKRVIKPHHALYGGPDGPVLRLRNV